MDNSTKTTDDFFGVLIDDTPYEGPTKFCTGCHMEIPADCFETPEKDKCVLCDIDEPEPKTATVVGNGWNV